jgi:hypothetical protein
MAVVTRGGSDNTQEESIYFLMKLRRCDGV